MRSQIYMRVGVSGQLKTVIFILDDRGRHRTSKADFEPVWYSRQRNGANHTKMKQQFNWINKHVHVMNNQNFFIVMDCTFAIK